MTLHLHPTCIGLKKKLGKLSKYKDCELIAEWVKTIINYLYWCAASVPDGDGKQMVTRCKSLPNRLSNKHDKCYHLPLGE